MSLWDEGVVGLINNSKLAIRMTTIIGVAMSTIAILAAFLYFVLKIIYWEDDGYCSYANSANFYFLEPCFLY